MPDVERREALRFCEFLRRNLDAIVARWEQAIRGWPAGRELSSLALRDHIPALLERIAQVVGTVHEGGSVSLGDLPEMHALDRLGHGFDLRAAAAELSVLRRVAVDLWRDHAAARDTAEVLAEVRRFDEAVDEVLALSVDRYARARQRTLASIDRVSEAGLATSDLEGFLRRLLDVLLETTEAANCAFVFLREGADALRIRAAGGVGAEEIVGFTLRIGDGFAGRVAEEKAPRFVSDAAADPSVVEQGFRSARVHALYGVPLLYDHALIGVACMGSASAYEYSDDDKQLFRAMGRRATAIIVQHQILAREREAKETQSRVAAELSQLFAIAPDILAVVGADGYLKRINPAFADLLGRPEEDVLSRPYVEFVHPDDRARTVAAAARVREGEPSRRFEFRLLRPTGQVRWMAVNAAPLPGADALICVGRDVTPEKERSDFEQQLIGIVSHDLRSPLSTIALSANVLLQTRAGAFDASAQRVLERIKSATDRAADLIRDLLDFTKARAAGGIPIEPQPLDLHAVAREAAEEVHASFADRAIRFESAGDGDGLWDRARVAQVVENLVSNAFKYGAPGEPVVVRTLGGDRWVRLEVHNGGSPIDPALLPHVFEPLRQARRTGGVGSVAGVGLGLYIVDHIVRAHGGTIDVHSVAAEGTTFIVRLPREPPSLP
jgi:PAS domain S-box-containing protein